MARVGLMKDALQENSTRDFFEYSKRFAKSGVKPLSEEEVMAEVKAVRKDRRKR